MANYRGIHGFNIPSLSSDPSNPVEGQIWFNTTSGVIKGYADLSGSWASGGATPIGVTAGIVSAGTATAALFAQGLASDPAGGYQKTSYEYDGTAWGTPVSMNRNPGAYTQGSGTQTAALSGGYYQSSPDPAGAQTTTETYDGSSWTTVNPTVNALGRRTGCGTQTATMEAGGADVTPSPVVGNVELYDGTNWTETTDLGTARGAGATHNGTSTANLMIGGLEPSISAKVEEWNGSAWTEITAVNTAREGMGGVGSVTLALVFGGNPGAMTVTESWNGSAWTELAGLSTGTGLGGSAGGASSNSSALSISGGAGAATAVTATEEWTSGLGTVTFSSS